MGLYPCNPITVNQPLTQFLEKLNGRKPLLIMILRKIQKSASKADSGTLLSWIAPIFPRRRLLRYGAAVDRKDVVIAVILRAGKVLICQRKAEDSFGGYWEFPGGKREQGETPERCLAREMMEELALSITALEPLPAIEHDYPNLRICLLSYLCTADGEPRPIACQRVAWVAPSELADYRFPEANAPLLVQIVRRLSNGASVPARDAV
jgi:8-oxo-dGTP diphosphatase